MLNVGIPELVQTPYINTISPEQEPPFPGDEKHGEAHSPDDTVERGRDGHPCQQALRRDRRPHLHLCLLGEPVRSRVQPFLPRQGRRRVPAIRFISRGMPPPASMPGRFWKDASPNRRWTTSAGKCVPGQGLSSYPHPRLMPDFWEFPTVSMGLGPLNAIYQARFNRYLQARGLANTDNSRVWCFPRRRRMRRAGSAGLALPGFAREARQPDLRRQLQPPAAGRSRARQRQDHPGTGDGLPRRRLERHQGDLGARSGTT